MDKASKQFDFRAQKESLRGRFNQYTRKAFLSLPGVNMPRILDIGCGTGVPTLELAGLSNGKITGLDTDQSALDRVNEKIKKEKLSARVNTINRSLTNLNFPDNWFDIIWAEGSVYVIGFKKCLKEWRPYIKPGGYLVVHDEQGNIEEKLQQINSCGYQLLSHFILDKDTWYREYFQPLEKLVRKAQKKGVENTEILKEITAAENEIRFFQNYPERNNSVFFIMKKNEEKTKIPKKIKMIEITKQPISPERIILNTKTAASGCVATYVGLIRDNSKGKRVASVTYQDKNRSAASELSAIADKAKLKWSLENVAITHRVGKLQVGDINLVIAVAAGHRKEGFAACRFIVDEFKKKIPTQKTEAYLK